MNAHQTSWSHLYRAKIKGDANHASYILMCITIIILLLAACSPHSPTATTPLAVGLAGLVEGRVDVGGYELYYACVGEGEPTVILEAGSENDSSIWNLVMIYYRKYTRICAYDRANLGKSDSAPKPRTFDEMTSNLHALLQNVPIDGPYVLVGYSMGGMLVRLFSGQYPENVVGVVLVDSAHPDMGARLLAALPPETAGEDKSFKAWRDYAAWMLTSDGHSKFDSEDVNNLVSLEQVRAVQSLGDLPLAVVSRSPDNPNMINGMLPLPEEINTAIMWLWQDMQAELEGLSSNSTRFTAARSDHGVPFYEPRLIVDAIRNIVDEYRAQAGIFIPPTPEQLDTASHVPVISGIRERKEWENGRLVIYEDISFSDPAGDAIIVINNLVAASVSSTAYTDDIIRASAAEQQQGTMFTTRSARCSRQSEVVIEYQVFDMAGNLSAPITVNISCPAPKSYLSPYVIVGIALILILLGLAGWYFVRHRRIRQ